MRKTVEKTRGQIKEAEGGGTEETGRPSQLKKQPKMQELIDLWVQEELRRRKEIEMEVFRPVKA